MRVLPALGRLRLTAYRPQLDGSIAPGDISAAVRTDSPVQWRHKRLVPDEGILPRDWRPPFLLETYGDLVSG
jgi:hypothetical protein